MKKLLSFLLVILVLSPGFINPPGKDMRMKMSQVSMAAPMKHPGNKGGCCNNKQNTGGTFCNFCVLCVAFIIPVKPGIQRNFATVSVNYPELVQSKLTDYNPSCWRPPNA